MQALIIDKTPDYEVSVKQVDPSELPDNDVLVDVEYSTLNYKDGLAITNASPIIRNFPMAPGIDFAGTVVESKDDRFSKGDKVVLNGWGVGERYWGGLSQQVKVKADWLIPLPETMSTWDAMAIGTAGYTAMLCVNALENNGVLPESGPILVTGATGGVGSIAVVLLAQKGYQVTASTGKEKDHATLKEMGASEVISRDEISSPGKPLQKEHWAGVVDVAGSHTLANACAATKYGGVVAACGLAQGMDFPASVAPFILRGVTLVGVDSVYQPYERRMQAWQALSDANITDFLKKNTQEIELEDCPEYAKQLIDGKISGRLVVKVG
ncbi:MDR family oxidoreductase [Glaciecola sp. 1036]|uniref:acrylyl-CoA reductase (NADPH) n=1 Tax=Alteromonadaceae TaxID=72275 RepID=UPI003D086A76